MNTIDVELTGFVYGGDAMGRLPDGRAVFVPYALPGEKARIEIVEQKRGHARARLIEVLKPSPFRIAPRCAHFGVCGGCHYQHLDTAVQLEVKTSILREQLQRLGGIAQPPLRPIVPSPKAWHYRNAIQFHLDRDGRVGFLRSASNEVIAIHECHLPEEPLSQLWPQLNFEPQTGIERVELRLGSEGDGMVVLEGSDPEPPEFEVDISASAVHIGPGGTLVLAGEDHLMIGVKDRLFQVSAGAFFQVNTGQAANMVDCLLEILPDKARQTILDVYCGAGLFSAFLAPRAQKLVGIELSPESCQDFAVNLDEFNHVELYQGPAEEVLPELHFAVDAVVVDPPRAGLERQALDAIIRLAPPVLAYVSCDPATLARDARRLLQGGYSLQHVTPFDLFPQTYAIESISLFTLASQCENP